MIVVKSIYQIDKEGKADGIEKSFYEYLTKNEDDRVVYIICSDTGGRNYIIFLLLYGRFTEREGDGDSK